MPCCGGLVLFLPSKKLKAKRGRMDDFRRLNRTGTIDRKRNQDLGRRSNIAGCDTHLTARKIPKPHRPTRSQLPQFRLSACRSGWMFRERGAEPHSDVMEQLRDIIKFESRRNRVEVSSAATVLWTFRGNISKM
jgi:hypothetical protein